MEGFSEYELQCGHIASLACLIQFLFLNNAAFSETSTQFKEKIFHVLNQTKL